MCNIADLLDVIGIKEMIPILFFPFSSNFMLFICEPIYLFFLYYFFHSVDIRDRDPNAAKRWSDETVFANRAYFLFDKLPGELAVQNAKDSDTGVYRCRVDFKIAQTRNSIVNLTIIGESILYI